MTTSLISMLKVDRVYYICQECRELFLGRGIGCGHKQLGPFCSTCLAMHCSLCVEELTT